MRFQKAALASYPRSGNTWMRHLLHTAAGLKSRYALNVEDGAVHRAGAIPEVADENATLIKTHACDVDQYDAAIHIVRNPMVAISSYLDYCRAFDVPIPNQDQFVQQESRGWLNHTEYWRMARECGVGIEYHPVIYERLCLETFGVLRDVCRFLGSVADHFSILHATKTVTLEAMQRRGSKEFFPQGRSRNPKTNLTLEQIHTIRQICGKEMKRWGYR